MGWQQLKQKKWFKLMTNMYILVLTLFVVWMVFFDTNSLLIHNELKREINKLEQQKDFLQKEIEKDKEMLKELSDEKALEKFAREQYFMKKDDEEIFLIEHEDSIHKSSKQ
ncbi:septum formation initiator family protein [uncultured Croceitalea sp.]|uniref:FtsB family cell division protein n=1 Tax=uncultured Croceitalea sp. TaxID=1798908 RepID=UPI003306062D